MKRLKNGERFGTLAKELSLDTGSAKRNGRLGYFGRGKMVKPFEDAAFRLKVGAVSEPVKDRVRVPHHKENRIGSLWKDLIFSASRRRSAVENVSDVSWSSIHD